MRNLLVVLALTLFIGCGNNPTPIPPGPIPPPIPVPPAPIPVPPVPVTTFEVMGKKIEVKGQMKEGAKVSLEEMRAAIRATVAQLEGLNLNSNGF